MTDLLSKYKNVGTSIFSFILHNHAYLIRFAKILALYLHKRVNYEGSLTRINVVNSRMKIIITNVNKCDYIVDLVVESNRIILNKLSTFSHKVTIVLLSLPQLLQLFLLNYLHYTTIIPFRYSPT